LKHWQPFIQSPLKCNQTRWLTTVCIDKGPRHKLPKALHGMLWCPPFGKQAILEIMTLWDTLPKHLRDFVKIFIVKCYIHSFNTREKFFQMNILTCRCFKVYMAVHWRYRFQTGSDLFTLYVYCSFVHHCMVMVTRLHTIHKLLWNLIPNSNTNTVHQKKATGLNLELKLVHSAIQNKI